jgi:hypothetical protein
MASGEDDKRLKRAMKEACDGSMDGFNRALATLESACALQPRFFSWYVSEMSRGKSAPAKKVKDLLRTMGTVEVDLHNLWVPAARAVSCYALSSLTGADSEPLRIITGKGKRAKCGQSVLFAVVEKLLRDAYVEYTCPCDGCFQVVPSAALCKKWGAYWAFLCSTTNELATKRPRMVMSNPSDVKKPAYVNPRKQDGVDRRDGMKRTKMRQRDMDRRSTGKRKDRN